MVFFFICSAACRGEDVPELTLEDCVRIGLERSVRMANARRDEQIAGARIRQARAQMLPEIKAGGGYTRFDHVDSLDTPAGAFDIGRLDNYAVSAEAAQLLYSGGSAWAELESAKLFLDTRLLDTARAEQELARDIEIAFYGILLDEANVEVQRASLEQLQALVAQAEAKFRNSTAPEFELLSARVRLANQAPVLILAQRNLDVAREAFRNLLWLEEEDFRLRGDLGFEAINVDFEEWLQYGLKKRPELERQARLIDICRQDISADQGKYLPTIKARAAYGGANPPFTFSSESEWDWNWNAGMIFEWDILDGGLRGARVLEKKLELAKAQDSLRDLERAVALEIRAATLDLKHAAEAVEASSDNVRLAETSMDMAHKRYSVGLVTYLEYTDANLSLSDARLIWHAALRAHRCALARLRCACGLSGRETPGDSAADSTQVHSQGHAGMP